MEKQLHEGHRARLRQSAKQDEELTSFSEFQVLEYFLSFIIPRKDTNPIAHALIEAFGSLYGVFQATEEELYSIKGMTQNAACFIADFLPISRKIQCSCFASQKYVSRLSDAVNVLRPYFYGRNSEFIYCLALDLNDRLLQICKISDGEADSVVINNNKILTLVTRTKAKKIILAHNHPAGNIKPSDSDLQATRMLNVLLAGVNARLSDHIIFSGDEYFSFYESDLLACFSDDNSHYANEQRRKKRSEGIYMEDEKPSEETLGEE